MWFVKAVKFVIAGIGARSVELEEIFSVRKERSMDEGQIILL